MLIVRYVIKRHQNPRISKLSSSRQHQMWMFTKIMWNIWTHINVQEMYFHIDIYIAWSVNSRRLMNSFNKNKMETSVICQQFIRGCLFKCSSVGLLPHKSLPSVPLDSVIREWLLAITSWALPAEPVTLGITRNYAPTSRSVARADQVPITHDDLIRVGKKDRQWETQQEIK